MSNYDPEILKKPVEWTVFNYQELCEGSTNYAVYAATFRGQTDIAGDPTDGSLDLDLQWKSSLSSPARATGYLGEFVFQLAHEAFS